MEDYDRDKKEQAISQLYYRRMIDEGLADEIREGVKFDGVRYVAFKSREEFLCNIAVDRFVQYLAMPTIIDSFKSNDERREKYSQSASASREFGDGSLYLQNRLRANKTTPIVALLGQLQNSRHTPISFKEDMVALGASKAKGYTCFFTII